MLLPPGGRGSYAVAVKKKSYDYLALEDARGLVARLQEGTAFRDHVQQRARLVAPSLLLFALIALACAAATAIFFADLSAWLALPGFLLAPAVLVGSFYVQALVFLGWLERRALAAALGHTPRGGLNELARVPWPLVGVALFVPLLMLLRVAPLIAVVLIAAGALVPFAYARLDRTGKSRLTRSRAAV